MKPEDLNEFHYKRWLIEGDSVLRVLEAKQAKEEQDLKIIRMVGAKMREKKEGKTVDAKGNIRYKPNTVKCVYKEKKVREKKPDFERNKFHHLDYKEVIRQNTTDGNAADNIKVIDFLDGNKAAVWDLFQKHKNLWAFKLRGLGIDSRSTEMGLEDLMMEAYIYLQDEILKGKYNGRNFFVWILHNIRYWILKYYDKNGYTVEYNRKNLYNGFTNAKKFL